VVATHQNGHDELVYPMNKGGTLRFEDLPIGDDGPRGPLVRHQGRRSDPVRRRGGRLRVTLDGGFTFYHAGDTAVVFRHGPPRRAVRPQLALLPIGDRFVMSPREAARAVGFLHGIEAVGPMHFGTFPQLSGTPAAFRAALAESAAARIGGGSAAGRGDRAAAGGNQERGHDCGGQQPLPLRRRIAAARIGGPPARKANLVKIARRRPDARHDRRASQEYGIPSVALMQSAGEAFRARLPRADQRRRGGQAGRAAVRHGNNGGDGFVAARHLANAGADVTVFLAGPAGALKGDAAVFFAALAPMGVRVLEPATARRTWRRSS
jgi:hypothetical protein